ncbi:flagellar basal body rod protein FlgG [Sporosarcina sp. E16_3]|uniref:flagellar hook-basal body complex protein n=1 Tax=Sporosarcina sp. E16_3 TaxID=2789293 RepID=UPI001A91EC94|nr:flagellar hook-basal body complex protein [Sporosarcina sp. E16_3]MBO0603037.1 flagellar basal body rod protein FlgG [Sporosarcina sp. E16_3]
MLRSMYSGISGLRNFQTKLDVIGNNIANVNTYGFKKGRTIFKDLISQTVAGASASGDVRGGVNAKQVGLGSQIAAIDTIHTGGSTQFTGNTLDLAVAGDGFFQVGQINDGEVENIQYTRAGNFYMDNLGYLVNGEGQLLVGVDGVEVTVPVDPATPDIYEDADIATVTPIDPTTPDATRDALSRISIPTTAQSMSIAQDGKVTFVDSEGVLKYAGTLVMAKFPNPGGLEKVGGNKYQVSPNSGGAVYGEPTAQGIGKVESGFLEMSNVDLAEEFTEMIVAQRGFQANTRIITTSDEILQELVNLKR